MAYSTSQMMVIWWVYQEIVFFVDFFGESLKYVLQAGMYEESRVEDF